MIFDGLARIKQTDCITSELARKISH